MFDWSLQFREAWLISLKTKMFFVLFPQIPMTQCCFELVLFVISCHPFRGSSQICSTQMNLTVSKPTWRPGKPTWRPDNLLPIFLVSEGCQHWVSHTHPAFQQLWGFYALKSGRLLHLLLEKQWTSDFI